MTAAALFAVTALAGGVGAALRFYVDGLVRHRIPVTFPLGTVLINVTGSFALGLIVGLPLDLLPDELQTVLGVGLLGGYTTFSTASFETARLAEERRYRAALVNGLGVLVACVLAALLGLWIGSAVSHR
jgi:CrcB protein